ncbi:DUF3168 domain-containing protein [Hansschlegelia zhihuaiae]|uniref:DUF3168 domain-containing protein n=1 Tax=Hansschlegelia zhihuaiae TaxID=405005 RepID=A0A4Q0MP00_9HYPH|nr:DUF3168 domain-containing protein [Hansschlegelia zhihuaiae]RXF75454.1 DUF3168 domain-containing protein [Hansschlegelia zhihuaiae]
MSSPALALRAAIHARLVADGPLLALLGGPRVYDEPPRGAAPPYVVLAECRSADVSGDETPAEEHRVALEIWSREGGLSQALKVSDRVARVIDGAALALDGSRLASLAWTGAEAARETDGKLRRAVVTFRAVTEPEP